MAIIIRFLNLFYLPTLHEETPTYCKAKPTQAPPELSPRERLEIQAAAVVRQMGDDPRTVAYMSDGLLQALINDFIKCNR